MYFEGMKLYLMGIWSNLIQVFPLLSLTITGIYSLSTDEIDERERLFITYMDVLGILCLWLQVFEYLMIWDDLIYLTRMLKEVISDMQEFLLMFLIAQFAFAEAFLFVNYQSEEKFTFLTGFFDSFRYVINTSLGHFEYSVFDKEENSFKVLCWMLLGLSQFISMIVMFNLLIAIIGDKYTMVTGNATAYMFKQRAHAIVSV